MFWVHPVARRYDDPIARRALRRAAYHYARTRTRIEVSEHEYSRRPDATPPLLLHALRFCGRCRAIQGWLDDEEADVSDRRRGAGASADFPDKSNAHRGNRQLLRPLDGGARERNQSAFAAPPRLYAIDPHDRRTSVRSGEGVTATAGRTLARN